MVFGLFKPRALLLTLPLLWPAAGMAEERFALIIGANAGRAEDRPLHHAEADATRTAEVLIELGDFPKDNVTVLLDPDTAQVRAQLLGLGSRLAAVQGTTLLFVYYSGHADEQDLHLRGDPLSFEELYQTLRRLPATVRIGVIDACRSGAMATKGGSPAAAFDVKVVDELLVRGLAVVTSSGADELSQERRALQGSVFTHHFLSGLRGAADFDRSGSVTLSESYRYAYQRTEADTAATVAPQRPAFKYDIKGQGELTLTWPERAASALLLPKSTSGRYVVVDDSEQTVVAEGSASPEREVSLALPAGRYRVKQVQPDALRVAALKLGDGVQVKASSLDYASVPLSAGFIKGAEVVAVVHHPRTSFWWVAGSAAVAGVMWAIAGAQTLSLRSQYSELTRPLTPAESQALSGWALTSDIAMGCTVALAIGAVFAW